MLVLTRRPGEAIHIGDDVIVKIKSLHHNQVAIAIQAPRTTDVHRDEIYRRIQKEKSQMGEGDSNPA